MDDETGRALLAQVAQLTAAQAVTTAALQAMMAGQGAVLSTSTVRDIHDAYAATWEGETWAPQMRATLKSGLAHFGDRLADSITRAEWIHWRDRVRAKEPTIRRDPKTRARTPPSIYTLNQEFKRWRSVYRFAMGEGLCRSYPLLDVKAKRGGKKHRHTRPTEADVIRLLVACSPRLRAFVIVGARTGMRASELRTTPWRNVDLERGRIKIEWHRVKTRKERWVPLTSDCVAALKAIRPDIPPRYVFESDRIPGHPVVATTLWIEFRKTVDRVGIEAAEGDGKVVYHDMRHVFASWAVERLPLPVVAAIGGWSDLRTMGRYIQVSDEEIASAQSTLEAAVRRGPKGAPRDEHAPDVADRTHPR